MPSRRPVPHLPTRRPATIAIAIAFWSFGILVPQPCPAAEVPAAAEPGESFRSETAAGPTGAPVASGTAGLPLAPIPARPESRLLDNARVFSDGQGEAIAGILREARERDGLDVYVVATTFVLGESVEEFSHRLAEAWLESPRGFILVYLRGEQTMTMSSPGNEDAFLSEPILRQIYEEAMRAAAGAEAPPERIRISLDATLTGVRAALQERAIMDRVLNPEVVRVLGFFLSALIVLGLAGWALARMFARLNQHQDARFVFPPTPVPPRFGAPFGGGVCAEIQFAKQHAG